MVVRPRRSRLRPRGWNGIRRGGNHSGARTRPRCAGARQCGPRPRPRPGGNDRGGEMVRGSRTRSDRCGIGNHRANVERSLLAQEFRRPHRNVRRRSHSAPAAIARDDQRNGRAIRCFRLRRQCRHRVLRRRHTSRHQSRNPQPPQRDRTLRRRQHRRGWRHPRCHRRTRASRRADRYSLLRPAPPRPPRASRGRAASGHYRGRRRRRRGRLRQQDGHPDGGRCRAL